MFKTVFLAGLVALSNIGNCDDFSKLSHRNTREALNNRRILAIGDYGEEVGSMYLDEKKEIKTGLIMVEGSDLKTLKGQEQYDFVVYQSYSKDLPLFPSDEPSKVARVIDTTTTYSGFISDEGNTAFDMKPMATINKEETTLRKDNRLSNAHMFYVITEQKFDGSVFFKAGSIPTRLALELQKHKFNGQNTVLHYIGKDYEIEHNKLDAQKNGFLYESKNDAMKTLGELKKESDKSGGLKNKISTLAREKGLYKNLFYDLSTDVRILLSLQPSINIKQDYPDLTKTNDLQTNVKEVRNIVEKSFRDSVQRLRDLKSEIKDWMGKCDTLQANLEAENGKLIDLHNQILILEFNNKQDIETAKKLLEEKGKAAVKKITGLKDELAELRRQLLLKQQKIDEQQDKLAKQDQLFSAIGLQIQDRNN